MAITIPKEFIPGLKALGLDRIDLQGAKEFDSDHPSGIICAGTGLVHHARCPLPLAYVLPQPYYLTTGSCAEGHFSEVATSKPGSHGSNTHDPSLLVTAQQLVNTQRTLCGHAATQPNARNTKFHERTHGGTLKTAA